MSNVDRLIKWGLVAETDNGMVHFTSKGIAVGNTLYRESENAREFQRRMSEHGIAPNVATMVYLGEAAEMIDNMPPDERAALDAMV